MGNNDQKTGNQTIAKRMKEREEKTILVILYTYSVALCVCINREMKKKDSKTLEKADQRQERCEKGGKERP